MTKEFEERLSGLENAYYDQISKPNEKAGLGNGVYHRYINPVLTAAHTPVFWRYDLNPQTNPYLMERFGINAVFNAGAIKWKGKYMLMARVEGVDRKSFFAIAESPNGVDNFTFWESPVFLPETEDPDTNIYDIRLTEHADGWIYGIFCTERRDHQPTTNRWR
jgi:4-O-beta-D-mannosyl-D-glucose phosphorylase